MPKKGYKQTEEAKRKSSKAQLKRKQRDGYINSPQARKKLRESLQKRKERLGYHNSPETRRKISESRKGMKLSKEHKGKISEAMQRRKIRDGYMVSPQARRKLSEALKGRVFSEEHKRKLREINLGKKLSEETKRKMSEERKGNKNPFYGKHHTEETRRKISETNKGKAKPKISLALKGRHLSPRTEFKKGHTPWSKGKKMWGKEGILKKDHPFQGKKLSKEHKRKLSEGKKDKPVPHLKKWQFTSEQTLKKNRENNPMWNLKSRLKIRDTRIRLIKEGKVKASWNKGLTKKTSSKLREIGNSISKVAKGRKSHYIRIFGNPTKRPEVRKKISASLQGIDVKDWKGFIGFEPYTSNWTEEFKNRIRKRDDHTCKICNINQEQLKRKLSIHHIDYNKKNCDPSNLISLCVSCHQKTNTNRNYWIEYFKSKQEIKWQENLERFGVSALCVKPFKLR